MWQIFLAGQSCGIPQSLGESMQIFLAGQNGKTEIVEDIINEDFSSRKWRSNRCLCKEHNNHCGGGIPSIENWKPYILESFYYMDDKLEKLIPHLGDFLLDSGAYTFMANKKDKNINWDQYVEEYANFVKKNKVKKYFELDIDNIIGFENVLKLRHKLEKLVGWRCIPVWHKSRGLDEWKKMTKEYDYVAIGGIVTKEIRPDQYDIFIPLLKIARQNKCKVHGLGFTNLKGIQKYHFNSVDSTAWTTGNRFGAIYKFNGKTMIKYNKPVGKRVKAQETAVNNFVEWLKFQMYAEKKL